MKHCKMGTYKHQIAIVPPWKDAKLGCKSMVGVDKCIAPLIIELWNYGIKTVESCCGHGVERGYIAVEPESVEQMERLGFKHDDKAGDPKTTFLL